MSELSDHALPRRRAPLRFVWQMDAEQRFTVGSDEFVALMGRATAAALGRPWAELAAMLSLDPEGQVALALASRETWSGLRVAWPVEGGAERLTVELSGLPIFDRERLFRGYRGFGICRDTARLAALMEGRRWQPSHYRRRTSCRCALRVSSWNVLRSTTLRAGSMGSREGRSATTFSTDGARAAVGVAPAPRRASIKAARRTASRQIPNPR